MFHDFELKLIENMVGINEKSRLYIIYSCDFLALISPDSNDIDIGSWYKYDYWPLPF